MEFEPTEETQMVRRKFEDIKKNKEITIRGYIIKK